MIVKQDRAISLNAAIDAIRHTEINFSVKSEIDFTKHKREVQEIINNILDAQEMMLKQLPPVTPQPKTGHWEWVQYDYNPKIGNWHCSECRCVVLECVNKEEKGGIPLYKYCPQCGIKMVAPQEREDKEK